MELKKLILELQEIEKNKFKIENHNHLSLENSKLKKEITSLKEENKLFKRNNDFLLDEIKKVRNGKQTCKQCEGHGGWEDGHGGGGVCEICGGDGVVALV